jgi:regulator of PEP synthase PpsR (kinase-PPPase family)
VEIKMQETKRQVVIIADSTGETAETVMRASLSQFGLKEIEIKKYAHVEEPEQIVKIIDLYKHTECGIAFTIILPELKETLKEECRKY